MESQDRGLPLPKFGEWDVNNPASAEGFAVIFNKARDEKKTNGSTAKLHSIPPRRNDSVYKKSESYQHPHPRKTKWLCCCLIRRKLWET